VSDKQFMSFEKGLILASASMGQPPESTPDCGNVFFSPGGKAFQRYGATCDLIDISAHPDTRTSGGNMFVLEDVFYGKLKPSARCQYLAMDAGGGVGHIWGIEENRGTGAKTPHYIQSYTTTNNLVQDRPHGVAFIGTGPTYETILCVGRSDNPVSIKGLASSPTVTTITHSDWVNAGDFPTICAAYNGCLWFSGAPNYPTRIWKTAVGSSTSFGGTGASAGLVLDLNMTSGGRIVGLKSLYNIFLIFTSQGVYRINGSDATDYTSVFVSPVAAVNQHSIVSTESYLFFMSQGTVYRVVTTLDYGDLKIEDVGIPIADAIEDTAQWKLQGTVGVYDDVHKRVFMFFESDYTFARGGSYTQEISQSQVDTELTSGNDVYMPAAGHALWLDVNTNAWGRVFFDRSFRYVVSQEAGDGGFGIEAYTVAYSVPAGSSQGTHIAEYGLFKEDVFDDTLHVDSSTSAAPTTSASAITAYIRTPQHHFESLHRRKTNFFVTTVFRNEEFAAGGIANKGALSLNYSVDYRDAADRSFGSIYRAHPLNTSTPGDASATEPLFRFRASLPGSGNVLQLEYINTVLGKRFELNGYEVSLRMRGKA